MLKFAKIYILIIILFFLSGGEIFGQTSNPEGELEKANSGDVWAQTMQGSRFNEFWNYHFYLDNGLKVHVTFSVANFGSFKSPVSGVKVSVYSLDEELHQISREYPLDQLVQDKENYVFKPHPDREVYFEGSLPDEHRIRVNTSKDGVSYDIDLSLENIAEGYKWGQGHFMVGNEQIGIVTHIPYAEVNGYVAVNDKKAVVNGTAYMDHTYQNQTTTRLLHSGYRFIYHEDSNNWDLLYFLYPSTKDSKTIGYRLINRGNGVKLQGAQNIMDMTRSESFKNAIAQDIELKLDNSKTITLSRSKDEEMFSVFSELNWIQKRAAKAFLGGEVLEFRGEAILTEAGKNPKTGNYNYSLVD